MGDYVMIKNVVTEAGVNQKFLPKFKGPYVVKSVLPNDRYCVTDSPDWQISQRPFKGILDPTRMRRWMSVGSGDVNDDDADPLVINEQQ